MGTGPGWAGLSHSRWGQDRACRGAPGSAAARDGQAGPWGTGWAVSLQAGVRVSGAGDQHPAASLGQGQRVLGWAGLKQDPAPVGEARQGPQGLDAPTT